MAPSLSKGGPNDAIIADGFTNSSISLDESNFIVTDRVILSEVPPNTTAAPSPYATANKAAQPPSATSMTDEIGVTGDRVKAPFIGRWLTKPCSRLCNSSILDKLAFRIPFLSNKASAPPVLPVSTPPSTPTPDTDIHPIVETLRENELGKLVLSLAVPLTVLLLFTNISGKCHKLKAINFFLVGLMAGCTTIWNGILFRKTSSRFADILEQTGISIVLLLIYGLVATFLPKGVSWICWLSGVFCLIPFVYARIKRCTAPGQASDVEKMVGSSCN